MKSKTQPNNFWPPTIWLVGETYAKERVSHKHPGAVAYVRADEYYELLERVENRINEGDVLADPNRTPNYPEKPESSFSDTSGEGGGL